MTPLRVTARLRGAISLTAGSLALDGLLAAAVALRDDLPPISVGGVLPIEIPVALEPGRRFHLASFAVPPFDSYDLRWLNRRFPIEQAQGLGGLKLKRINLAGGPCKSFRVPMEHGHAADDELTWWCLGDESALRELLGLITHLGRRRGVGSGRVERWRVERCQDWPGFPVVRAGRALRPLPLDWPGLVDPSQGYGCLSYPYWRQEAQELLAMPEATGA